jgi:hypothetical protein
MSSPSARIQYSSLIQSVIYSYVFDGNKTPHNWNETRLDLIIFWNKSLQKSFVHNRRTLSVTDPYASILSRTFLWVNWVAIQIYHTQSHEASHWTKFAPRCRHPSWLSTQTKTSGHWEKWTEFDQFLCGGITIWFIQHVLFSLYTSSILSPIETPLE